MTDLPNWQTKLSQLISAIPEEKGEIRAYMNSNEKAVRNAVSGRGPDDSHLNHEAGARMVVNISAVHVPAFCKASRAGDPKPYKNGYDLGQYRIGSNIQAGLKNREIVDRALPLDGENKVDNVYFGAVELNGTGIRFYGDVCMVLEQSALKRDTVILDRNSYDLIRSPIRERVDAQPQYKRDEARKDEALKLRGDWNTDLGWMAAIKVIGLLGQRTRRYTTGQIAQALRDDEDYLEVLKIGSFATWDLQEVRISASEAAQDAWTGDRLRSHRTPRLEALMARHRRSRAEEDLRRNHIHVRIVTTPGRTKD